jgi:hypothetical protein
MNAEPWQGAAGDQENIAYSVSFQRSYLHQNEWKVARSIRAHEIPVLLHALSQAHAFILESYRQS